MARKEPEKYSLDPEEVKRLESRTSGPGLGEEPEGPCLFVITLSFLGQIENWVTEGPGEDEAVCVNCQNNSYGDKCESCLHGYFLLDGKCTK